MHVLILKYKLKYIFIAKDIFKLYLIPDGQIPGYPQKLWCHVGPSDGNFSRLNQFPNST